MSILTSHHCTKSNDSFSGMRGSSRYRYRALRTARISRSRSSSSVGIGVGCRGNPTGSGITGVRQGDGSGAKDVEGVLEDERDTEGNDAARREVLSSENRANPRA
jgi:hypothetical protein